MTRETDLLTTVSIKANPEGAKLTRANLEGANLRLAIITNADFTGATTVTFARITQGKPKI